MPTYCNPIDLGYRFQLDEPFFGTNPCREAADPSVVRWRQRYWLFASKSGGYWHSTDLRAWDFVASTALPVEDYAPDVTVIDDTLVVTASNRGQPSPVFRAVDPFQDTWKHVCDLPEHHDPALFQDDDGRVYRYWGCSNRFPLYVQELDRESLQPCGRRVEIPVEDMQNLGWQRRGAGHRAEDLPPHVEGPWVSKHAGRYYLEYAAPGTQYDIYADAVLVADHPLGPFQAQAHNPTCYHPSGFMPGSGHGSTFQDEHGNWWHVATMRISVRHKFERRIGLWPAGFDAAGVFFCTTAFGDWPIRLPTGRWNPLSAGWTGWMLLSRAATCQASSVADDHPPQLAVDENAQTWWAAAEPGPASVDVDLGTACTVHAVQINLAEHDATQHGHDPGAGFRYRLEGRSDAGDWQLLAAQDRSGRDHPHSYVALSEPMTLRHIRLHLLEVASGHAALCGLRVFGLAPGTAPGAASLSVERSAADPRNATVHWQADGAEGALLRWGVASDQLYGSQLLSGPEPIELRFLDRRQPYFFTLQAWNRSGLGTASAVVACPLEKGIVHDQPCR